MPLDDVYDYFRAYDRSTFEVFACQGNEPSDEDVSAFEREIGFRLPVEFRQFTMSPLGGLHMDAQEAIWPRPKGFAGGPFWSFLRGVQVFGIASDIPEFLDLRAHARKFRDAGIDDLVPFLKVIGDSDPYCFNSTGQIVRWRHEEPELREPESLTFSELLMREIRELEERVRRKRAGADRHPQG